MPRGTFFWRTFFALFRKKFLFDMIIFKNVPRGTFLNLEKPLRNMVLFIEKISFFYPKNSFLLLFVFFGKKFPIRLIFYFNVFLKTCFLKKSKNTK